MIKHIIAQTLGMFVFKTENLAERQIPSAGIRLNVLYMAPRA